MGIISCANNDLEKAIRSHNYALEIGENLKDENLIAENYNNLGVILAFQGELITAKDYFEAAENMYENFLKDDQNIQLASVYFNLGDILLNEKM